MQRLVSYSIAQESKLADGQLAVADALTLLADVSQSSTQWSVVYGIATGEGNIVMGRHYDKVYAFRLPRAGTTSKWRRFIPPERRTS
ncbi:MAG TPA: hypothetical protein PKZ84_12315 [Anaerolineae bacterium]|nr:hypothetical protein [Anaerolineae bacterium]HQI85427.1 hypothetical protein [Anaerolineae bacterium]